MNDTQKIIKNKVGLLNLAEELNNISEACKILGYSRDSFYRYKKSLKEGGLDGLLEKSRRKPNYQNRLPNNIEAAILDTTLKHPTLGRERIADLVKSDGIHVSSSGVYGVWRRKSLNTLQKRLKWLDMRSKEESLILTEEQKLALEQKADDQVACGVIETHHPGYLGSQDTFYVGSLKGVGRIYQQTFVDTYSKVAMCKLYNNKTALTAADILNDKVIPFFDEQKTPLLRILTDRGSEYNGKIENGHNYQLYLQINEIVHSRTKAYSPQTNGICERFHRTILDEFYRIIFRKKRFETIEQLQLELDFWLVEYNTKRIHRGKHCCGRTPMITFVDGMKKWNERQEEIGIKAS